MSFICHWDDSSTETASSLSTEVLLSDAGLLFLKAVDTIFTLLRSSAPRLPHWLLQLNLLLLVTFLLVNERENKSNWLQRMTVKQLLLYWQWFSFLVNPSVWSFQCHSPLKPVMSVVYHPQPRETFLEECCPEVRLRAKDNLHFRLSSLVIAIYFINDDINDDFLYSCHLCFHLLVVVFVVLPMTQKLPSNQRESQNNGLLLSKHTEENRPG